MKSDIILVNENEDLFEVFAQNNINIYQIKDKIKIIASKVKNNRVGYFQFKSKDNYIKLCVLPKVIDKTDEMAVEKFLKCINEYLRLIHKYKKKDMHGFITESYLDIIDTQIGNIESFNSIMNYKYLFLIEEISKFFKKYKKSSYRMENTKSNILKYDLDIRKNIIERNKSIIHQRRREEENHSEIADITYAVLNYFLKYKGKSLYDGEAIKRKAIQTKNYLIKKFIIKKFNIRKITKYNTRKLFKGKKMKKIYYYLLVLLDLEGYFNKENDSSILSKLNNIAQITFRPEVIFEYNVYDKYYERKLYNELYFSRIHENIIKKAYLAYLITSDKKVDNLSNLLQDNRKKIAWSIPDIISDDTIIDCKWKILKHYNGKNDLGVLEQDLLKLKSDCVIRNANKGVLVYPKVNEELRGMKFDIPDNETDYGVISITIEECKII